MHDTFQALATAVDALLAPGEAYTLGFRGEASDFVRLNRGAIRQAGSVAKQSVVLDLIAGRRHAQGTLTLSGHLDADRPRLARLVHDLRARRAVLPEDPHLSVATTDLVSAHARAGRVPEAGAALDAIVDAGGGHDLVGIYAAGDIASGFASSWGQRCWFQTRSFNLDWCLYDRADKAVKSSYAGFDWDDAALSAKMAEASAHLAVLRRPPVRLDPGRYRVHLAPAALWELVGLLAWDSFGLRAHRTRQTSLLRMIESGARLSPALTLHEDTAEGVAPNFQEDGFLRPDRVPLITAGAYADCLVSPRSAREFGVETNGATAAESPESLDIGAGAIPRDRVLAELGEGLTVGSLWYLNYSDRSACRTTGMTRFATFWVEGGEVQAPVEPMRFDESVFRALGDSLIGLTAERELLLSASTYGGRATESCRAPGAVIDGFTFTL